MNSLSNGQDDDLPFLPALSIVPNLVSWSGFLYGIEAASLGNTLSTFANLIAFSVRNHIPVIYPEIMNFAKLFGFTNENLPYVFSADPFTYDRPALGALVDFVEHQAMRDYYPGYMDRLRTVPPEWVAHIGALSSATIFIRYDMKFADLGFYENRFTRSAARGNILVVPGAYWWQYRTLPVEAAQAVRTALPISHVDAQQRRQAMMADRANAGLRIGIHVRRGDYRDYMDGIFYWDLSVYIEMMRSISRSLNGQPHLFVICSNEAWDSGSLEGLPCVYEQGDTYDDFVALCNCDYVVGPPSTFSNWASFLGNNLRLILTPSSLALLDERGLSQAKELSFPTGSGVLGDFWHTD